ncbi:MAG: MerR family transcriptional regulator [Chloroflexi bacterium]|nr:MAG: MerR family transcriptional regulator [Chloroflexota bacterium]
MYTVKQLADLAGVSRRTLHYYDEIGLLRPFSTTKSGYRQYDDSALFRLQQILFFREIGLDLRNIKEILDDPDFDLISALRSHRQTMQEKKKRLETLIQTVDTTIMHLIGDVEMSKKNIFDGFNEEKQKQYEKEAVDNWGETASESIKLWNSYSEERKAEIMQEGSDIYQEIVTNMGKGTGSPEIRALLVRWHQHMRYFYEPSIETLGGLGNMYDEHPDFNATFTKMHPDLPGFLKEAIAIYVDELETQWLERELGILEESD